MTEVTAWFGTDASNNSAAPAGAPEGMAPSGLNDTLRAVMGGVARRYARADAPTLTGGTATAYTVTYSPSLAAYVNGESFLVEFHTACSAAPTINFNSLGALPLHRYINGAWAAVAANSLGANTVAVLVYNSVAGSMRVVSMSNIADINIANLTLETAPATGDIVPIYDASAAANRGMLIADFLKVTNNFAEETNLDFVADYLAFYDSSVSAMRKMRLRALGVLAPITTLTAASSSSLDYAFDTTVYSAIILVLDNLKPATDLDELRVRLSIDGGSTYITTSTYTRTVAILNATYSGGVDTADHIQIGQNLGNTTGEGASGIVRVNIGGATQWGTRVMGDLHVIDGTPSASRDMSSGINSTASQVNAIRIFMSTGNITSGTIRVYGIVK